MKPYTTNDMIAAARKNGFHINFSGRIIETIRVTRSNNWIFIESKYYHDHCCSYINGPSRIGSVFFQRKPSGEESISYTEEGEKWFGHFGHTVENCLDSYTLSR